MYRVFLTIFVIVGIVVALASLGACSDNSVQGTVMADNGHLVHYQITFE